MFIDFIEIGTSDFDTEIQKKDNRFGLSIEPVKYYIDLLPNKAKCKKLNIAITDKPNTKVKVYYISVENIEKYNLPEWVRGCNTVNYYHPTVKKLLKMKGIDIKDISETYEVCSDTLYNVMNKYEITGVYYLKIDTEGYDVLILQQFLKDIENNKELMPHKILFESNILTLKKYVQRIITLYTKIGYDLIETDNDTLIKLNLQKIKNKKKFTDCIQNYYISEYPPNYNLNRLPHNNTLEDAKEYCLKHQYSGITFQYGRFEVRSGKYIEYFNDKHLLTWIAVP